MKLKMTKKKLLAAIVSTALLCGVGVGGTVAWLHDSAQVTNKFDLASLTGEISEDPPGEKDNVKRDVYFTNTGEVNAYLRVAFSASWMTTDDEGNQVIAPEKVLSPTDLATTEFDDDYTIVWGDKSNWRYYQGYFYYLSPLEPGGETPVLITSVTPEEREEDYQFRFDVSAQLIQAEPEDAVKNAWGVVITEEGVSEAPQNP